MNPTTKPSSPVLRSASAERGSSFSPLNPPQPANTSIQKQESSIQYHHPHSSHASGSRQTLNFPTSEVLLTKEVEPGTLNFSGRARPRGKIAELPQAQRDLINQLLDDGATYAKVRREMAQHGVKLNGENISNWFDSGYQTHLQHKLWLQQMAAVRNDASGLLEDYDPVKFHQAANQLATIQIFQALKEEKFTDYPQTQARMLNVLARLGREALALLKYQELSRPEPETEEETEMRDTLALAHHAVISHLAKSSSSSSSSSKPSSSPRRPDASRDGDSLCPPPQAAPSAAAPKPHDQCCASSPSVLPDQPGTFASNHIETAPIAPEHSDAKAATAAPPEQPNTAAPPDASDSEQGSPTRGAYPLKGRLSA